MAEFITDVFLVSSRGSDVEKFILETTIRNHDGNLWESSWRNKAKRFIGFKRDRNDEFVVTDITVIGEDKDVPDDYAGLLITHDSKEKGLRKQIVCYRREARTTAKQAITEINVINESKGELVPAQFTAMNESINELLIVFKVTDLPDKAPPLPAPRKAPPVEVQQPLQRAVSVVATGIDGVPFQINPKYNSQASLNDPIISGISHVSIDELIQKYSYSFTTEKKVVQTS